MVSARSGSPWQEQCKMVETLEHFTPLQRKQSQGTVASLAAVNKSYGEVRALRRINFQVRAGEVVALLGPKAAGKTTAVKLLLGLLQPNGGKVRVFGGDPVNPENRMRTGAMLQVGRAPETLRVREHI
jgi:ABC-2 type transport system ATP-binding protein